MICTTGSAAANSFMASGRGERRTFTAAFKDSKADLLFQKLEGSYDDHVHLGAELAKKILEELEITTPEETAVIYSAIYHHDDKENHTPYYSLHVPASWIGHTTAVLRKSREKHPVVTTAYATPADARNPDNYQLDICFHNTEDDTLINLITFYMFTDISTVYNNYSKDNSYQYYGLISKLTQDRSRYRIHFVVREYGRNQPEDDAQADAYLTLLRSVYEVTDNLELKKKSPDGSWLKIDTEFYWWQEYWDYYYNEYEWQNKYYDVPLPQAYYDELKAKEEARREKERQKELLKEEEKRAKQKRAASKAKKSSSSYKTDPYDVYDYDDPDDFADYWADEFDDEWSDEDEAWDDAYDYWVEHH